MHKHNKTIASLLAVAAFVGASSHATPLVEANWVSSNLDNANVVLVDLRKAEDYDAGHIPGAINATYGKFGWRETIDNVVGMLPAVADINQRIGSLGIRPDSHVVVIPYGKNSSDVGSAARVYWTFKVLGHDNVSLLNGGMNAWEKAGQPLSVEVPSVASAGAYPGVINDKLVISTSDLLDRLNNNDVVPVDARTDEQWIGEAKHPKSRIPGAIPTAKRLPQAELVNPDTGKFATAAEVQEVAKAYGWVSDGDLPFVSYCNTGHWASTAWFALSEVAGVSDVILYDGSMVAWTGDESNPLINAPSRIQQLFTSLFGES